MLLRGSSFLPPLPSARVSPQASSTLLTAPPATVFSRPYTVATDANPAHLRLRALEVDLEHLRAVASQARTNAGIWQLCAAERAYATRRPSASRRRPNADWPRPGP